MCLVSVGLVYSRVHFSEFLFLVSRVFRAGACPALSLFYIFVTGLSGKLLSSVVDRHAPVPKKLFGYSRSQVGLLLRPRTAKLYRLSQRCHLHRAISVYVLFSKLWTSCSDEYIDKCSLGII